MKENDEDEFPKRWKLLPHSRTHRLLVLVVLIVAVAIMIRLAS